MSVIRNSRGISTVIGWKIMKKFQINPGENGSVFKGYDERVDVSIANSFATAAFRFAHSLIPGVMKLIATNTTEYIQLHKLLVDPFKLYEPGEMDKVIKGATQTQIQASDVYFTKEVCF